MIIVSVDAVAVAVAVADGSEMQVLIAWEDLPFPTALANWMCI
jgi:hypothetical protein